MQTLREFPDDSYLSFDSGSFDEWCVYYIDKNGKEPPRDIDYFSKLVMYAKKYGNDVIYADFVGLYDKTGKNVDETAWEYINDIILKFDESDRLEINKLFSIIYMAMISEENKENTRLGKRIKRLGIYKLLIEQKDVTTAANFMRGMSWRDINILCSLYGF